MTMFSPQRARQYVRPHEDPPKTPRGVAHNKINSIIKTIERNHQLGLAPRAYDWSPSSSAGSKRANAVWCEKSIAVLYFRDKELLYQTINIFDTEAPKRPPTDRLPLLRRLLDDAKDKHNAQKESKHQTGTYLQSEREQVATWSPHHSMKLQPAPSSVSNRPSLRRDSPVKVPLNDENTVSYPELESTQPDTQSDADEEERIGSPPQSPSLRASLRRQGLSRLSGRGKPENQERRSPRSNRVKRTSDTSIESERSRTSGDNHQPETSFAVPQPPLVRKRSSHSSLASSRPHSANISMTASFASTTLSRSDSVFSTFKENTTTANTSFATSVFHSQPSKSQQVEEFHSSGTFGSIGTEIDFDQAIENARAARSFGATDQLGGIVLNAEEESLQGSPNIVSPSKSMENHRVRDLPQQGLFCPKDIGSRLQRMPFKYRWEFMRVALEANVEPDSLLPQIREDLKEYSALWKHFEQHFDQQENKKAKHAFHGLQRSSASAWSAAEVSVKDGTLHAFENVDLKASLTFNEEETGPLFKLHLQPLKIGKSCRFQRAFGGDRYLYIETPSLNREKIPEKWRGQAPPKDIAERFDEWLAYKPKKFLGREWEVMHVEPLQPKKKTLHRQNVEMRGHRVILFATRGCDIDRKKPARVRSGTRHEMTVFDSINWLMPLGANRHQPYLKAFARISLGLTTTEPGLTFKPSQVRYVRDKMANDEHEDRTYNDKTLVWPKDMKREQRIMNDGCSRMSVGAAKLLWKELNKEGPIPSAFQGRIGGAKGMWMISDSPDTRDPAHLMVWIEISDSQLKFEPHPEDMDQSDTTYDPVRLTFDLHSTTNTAEESNVYLQFFPILEDRGVSSNTLQKLFENHLDQEREKLMESIDDRVRLRQWINQQNTLKEERNRDDDLTWQAAMPLQLQERAILLLESGFDTSCDYVADVTQRLVAKSLRLMKQDVRVRLSRCTYIKGVADPLGVLKPGEIHIQFIKGFVDEVSGDCLNYLHDRPVLVARNPALRRSDIQKVRATFKLELGHLKDVVVFPSKGKYPLASKLQGGDYDGDTFWVCWEPDMVEPFKNAPPPLEDPIPENCGIEVDRRKLRDMWKEGKSISKFLRESFKFRLKPSLVGQATKLYEKVVYMDNRLDTKRAQILADLHDLLVDHAKNGYVFDQRDFEWFKRELIKLPGQLPKPKYEEARDMDREDRQTTRIRTRSSTKFNTRNILDRLYFQTVEPHIDKTLQAVETRFKEIRSSSPSPSAPDADLCAPFLAELAEAEHDPEIAAELETLTDQLHHFIHTWNKNMHPGGARKKLAGLDAQNDFEGPDVYGEAVAACFPLFRHMEPVNEAASPVIRRWHAKALNHGPCTHWELLRASALYHVWMNKGRGWRGADQEKKSSVVFQMAGIWLCWIKAARVGGGCQPMVYEIWKHMKPRAPKRVVDKGNGAGRAKGEGRFGTGPGRVVDNDEDDDEFGAEGSKTAYESAEEGFTSAREGS